VRRRLPSPAIRSGFCFSPFASDISPYSPASLSVESTGAATMPQVYALVTGSLERSRWHDYYVMGVAHRGFGQRFPLTP
jgi:hypothetical protein